jgi:hypothetical protein
MIGTRRRSTRSASRPRGEEPGRRQLPVHHARRLRKAYDEFMTGKGSPTRKASTTQGRHAVPKAKRKRNKPSSISGSRGGRAWKGRTWPCWPRPRVTSGSRSTSQRCARPARATRRTSRACTRSRTRTASRHKAYRLVLYAGAYGEYYGLQGMDLALPADPRRPRRLAQRSTAASCTSTTTARTCGSSPGGPSGPLYWVTNTLSPVDPEQPADRHRRLRPADQALATLGRPL